MSEDSRFSFEDVQPAEFTPLPIIARVSRVVAMLVDRISGDRAETPLLVCMGVVEALKRYGIESRVMYGQAAWVEVLEDQTPIWTGCWGENFTFWCATAFGEVVDLTVSVAHRKRPHDRPDLKAQFAPPMLWSAEVPKFYRYQAEGVAELELTDPADKEKLRKVLEGIAEHCGPLESVEDSAVLESDFPNEAILCSGRRLLDDSKKSFRMYDRALSVHGIPEAPL